MNQKVNSDSMKFLNRFRIKGSDLASVIILKCKRETSKSEASSNLYPRIESLLKLKRR